MAGFKTELARNVNLTLGTASFGPVLIDNDVKRIGLSFSRENWTSPDQKLSLTIEESVDGAAFKFLASLTASGVVAPADGRENVTSITIDLSPGSNRRVRGSYTCSGQRIRTTINVIAEV